ncbi:hypothetical protein, partial [Mycolicibacterium sp. 120270]|uniref:hypothetical protein n=1 Tax=Mycolicibacterium sp. 120270 TaxID=3090600 RepID=UPI00299D5D6C
EESRDDPQSVGYDTPVPLIRSDSYTTLLDATATALIAFGYTAFRLHAHEPDARRKEAAA